MLTDRQPTTSHGYSQFVRTLLVTFMLLPAVACDSLVDVEPDPHTVPGEELSDPSSLNSRIIGAEADFWIAYDMAIVWAGLYADPLANLSWEVDQRTVQADDGLIGAADMNPEGWDGLWTPMQRAAFTSNAVQQDILDETYPEQIPNPQGSAQLATMSLFAGYSKLVLGEFFCTTAFNGTGPEYTSQETYQLAADEFTRAIDAADAPDDVRYAALVGRARARLQMGNLEGAVADASRIPMGWEYIGDAYSDNSQLEQNDIWNMLTDSQRFTVAEAFRNLMIDDTTVDDPRVEVFQDPTDRFTADGTTPLWQAEKYLSATAPIRLASWYEAQYIIAEVEAANDNLPTAVQIINDVRAAQDITVQWSSSDRNEVLSKVLDERGRTLFLEGQRMGDLRRYLDRYDINAFPTGENYGDGTCFLLPNAERFNNPDL